MTSHTPRPVVLIQNPPPSQHKTTTPTHRSPSIQQNGPVKATALAPRSSSGRYRAPTLNEALPLTPLTSIIPFSIDMLPLPNAFPTSKPNIFTSDESRAASKTSLNRLNSLSSNDPNSSQKRQEALDKVTSLLKRDGQITYKFPPPKTPRVPRRSVVNGTAQSKTPALSTFASMVADTVNFPHRSAVEPGNPAERPSSKSSMAAIPKKMHGSSPSQRSQVAVVVVNKPPTLAVNSANTNPPDVRASPVAQQTNMPFQISLPRLNPAESATFTSNPKLDARLEAFYQGQAQSTKKRKRIDENYALTSNQQEKASEALFSLEQIVDQVLDAAESFHANPSELTDYFLQSSLLTDDDPPVLTQNMQTRVESAIQKTVSAGVFQHFAVSQLTQLQKLLQGTVSCVSELSLDANEHSSEADLDEWVRGLELSCTAMQAARVLLRTMTAEREEKEVYSEEFLDTAIQAFTQVTDRCILPVIEVRSSSNLYKIFAGQRKLLLDLLQLCARVLRQLGDLVSKVNFAETSISQVEDLAIRLIFTENATSDKDSVLGVQRFETMRRAAMDAVAEIFTRHQTQRTYIFDEILMHLEKLPSTRQSARQFKIGDGKPIQLVSALLMRLVQASTMWTDSIIDSSHQKARKIRHEDTSDGSDSSDDEASPQRQQVAPVNMDHVGQYDIDRAAIELRRISSRLFDAGWKHATYVVQYLVRRALTSTKSGDQPYRNLLDIFTEDFLNVLDLPEWPAAELLLRVMLQQMVMIMKDEKRPVPQRNMALDLMTLMGTRITDLQIHARNVSRTLDSRNDHSPVVQRLETLFKFYQDNSLEDADLIAPGGPYRIIFEHLSHRVGDAQTSTARSLLLVQWAHTCLNDVERAEHVNVTPEMLLQIRNTIPDHAWLGKEYEFPTVDLTLCKAAFTIVTASSQFCKGRSNIIEALLISMASQHSQLKSKGLKNVTQLLEKDPSMIERDNSIVLQSIITCTSNASPLVRQSALQLLERCILIKPSIEIQAFKRLVVLTVDENMGVKKRSLKILKDIYVRNTDQELRMHIAAAFLRRIEDTDEGVVEQARQSMEELWMQPFYQTKRSEDTVEAKLAVQHQVKLIVYTLRRGDKMDIFEDFLAGSLRDGSKNAKANFAVCRTMISIMFDLLIDNDCAENGTTQFNAARALSVYAKVAPKLFTGQQMKLLEPYVKNLQGTTDNLILYKTTCIIYRYVLPTLSSVEKPFLCQIQDALKDAVLRVYQAQLSETAECLWLIATLLDDYRHVMALLRSTLEHLDSHKRKYEANKAAGEIDHRVVRYISIIGAFTNACQLDSYVGHFRPRFPDWKGSSVAGLAIDLILPFTGPKISENIRRVALHNAAIICQAWPQQYLRQDVGVAFKLAFESNNVALQYTVLDGFSFFFVQEEKQSESGAAIKIGQGAVHGGERLSKTYVASDSDGAITTIAQKFLDQILRVALERIDDLAVIATRVTASINRQGLVHPKECGPALVALETSSNAEIASIAVEAHRALHEKHESMFEKEYMKAVAQVFKYQKDVIKDPRGIVPNVHPLASKLRPLFEMLKAGSGKVRKRFITNLASRARFELSQLDFGGVDADTPDVVLFARFVMENLACFEYPRLDELLLLVASLEKMVVAGEGAAVAHCIETEILKVQLHDASQPTTTALSSDAIHGALLDPESNQYDSSGYPSLNPGLQVQSTNGYQLGMPMPAQTSVQPPAQMSVFAPSTEMQVDAPNELVNPTRLRQLTVASMILTIIWETRTHLRQMWGLQKSKAKLMAKDINRAPSRVPFASSQTFVDKLTKIMQSLESPAAQLIACRQFAELVAIDNELKIEDGADDEADMLARQAAGYDTPDEEADATAGRERSASIPGSATKGRKRKSAAGGEPKSKRAKKSATPKKSAGRPRKRSTESASLEDGDRGWD